MAVEKTILLSYKLNPQLGEIVNLANAVKVALSFCSELIFSVNVCLEELITNTILYGFKGSEGGKIEITIYLNNNYLEILIEDNAPEFNPFIAVAEPDVMTSLSNRVVGGLGVHFVKKMMDKYSYSHSGHGNQVSIFKKIS